MIDQIKLSDQWAFYQAKSIKNEIRNIQPFITGITLKSPEAIKNNVVKFEHSSEINLSKHGWLAKAVTFFQVAIAISTMSVLTKKTVLWFVGILLSIIGLLFLLGLL